MSSSGHAILNRLPAGARQVEELVQPVRVLSSFSAYARGNIEPLLEFGALSFALVNGEVVLSEAELRAFAAAGAWDDAEEGGQE